MGISSLWAGGYQVGLHGQKEIGMGLVGTSLTLDASCMFYNPGGLGFVKDKISFAAGISPLKSIVSFKKVAPSSYTTNTDNPIGTPFYIYGSYKINDKLGFGIAVNTPYGNSLKWKDNWAGKFLIEQIKLKAIFVQPTVSYKFNDMLSVGAGLVYSFGDVDIKKAIPVNFPDGSDGQAHIKGTATSMGFNVGVLLKPIEKLQIGIDYRSLIKMKVTDGDVTMDVPASLASSFPTTNKVEASLPLPANLDFGASYQVNDKLLVAISFNYVFWDVYDSLIFDFKTNTSTLADSRNPRKYSNTLIFRAGAQYQLNEMWTVRAGTYYDPSPVNKEYFNPETPSLNNLGLTCGFSVVPMKHLSIDFSFLFLMGLQRDAIYTPDNFGGTYKTYFYIPGIGLTYSL